MQDRFGVARAIFAAMEYIGWGVVGLGVLGGVLAVERAGFLGAVAGGLVIALAGLLVVGTAQIGRAQIVTAEATQEMAAALRGGAMPGAVGNAPDATSGPAVHSPPVTAAAGLVKVYRDVPIYRDADGRITAGDQSFDGVLAAERAIAGGLTG